MNSSEKTQSQKFKDLARAADCEEDEGAFEEKLKRITKATDDSAEKAKESKKNKQ